MNEEIKMKRVKDTKNCAVFEPTDDSKPQPITSLYIQKWACKDAQQITVTVKGE